MNFYTNDKPIIACSTGSISNTAIALIRLSGFKNLAELQPFFSISYKKIKKRVSHLTNLVFDGKIYDQILLVYFPEGESYTGENVLELSVHGNQLNIQNILNLFLTNGSFEHARAGEFTYRALKNKKISLSQVEGLDMLLNANSNLMLSQGLDILQGNLHAEYMFLYKTFLKLKSSIEIASDFSEDVGTMEASILLKNSFEEFFKVISSLKSRTEGNLSSLMSPDVILVGQTNAGKSSLFNILLKHDRSIVSPLAGTTRDYISEMIHIKGVNFLLMDTAGVRNSLDQVEQIGIGKAFNFLARAFYKILIINPFETNEVELKKFENINFDLLIFSHLDEKNFEEKLLSLSFKNILAKNILKADLRNEKSGSIEPPLEKFAPGSIGPIIHYKIWEKFQEESSKNPILLERHRTQINKIYYSCLEFKNNIGEIDDIAILSSELSLVGAHLSELIGIISPDEVLNSIFSNFCIGK